MSGANSSLYGANGAPLSQRKVRDSVDHHHIALVTLTKAMQTFFRMSFRQRLAWVLFGARSFPKPDEEV
jgi:hypothetical protein